MRDIKFRAWDTENKEMVLNVGIDDDSNQPIIYDKVDHIYVDVIGVPMQFTGLTDMNGVDIYEGDIVKSHFYGDDADFDCIAEVYYCDAEARYKFKDSEVDAYVYGIEINCLEVVGHIYER